MKPNNNLKPLSQIITEEFGEIGTEKRTEFEDGYKSFKLGSLVHDARIEKGLTQEQLAIKCGTNKFIHFKSGKQYQRCENYNFIKNN